MDRPTKQDKKKSDDSFLSRWSARKAQIAKGELVADEKPALTVQEVNEGELGNDEEAKLSDQELLEKYPTSPLSITAEKYLESLKLGGPVYKPVYQEE